MNMQLPEGWKTVKVGEYVISVKGKKPKRVSNIKTKECSIPYVNIKAFEKRIIDEYTDGVGCALCEDGDFLMVWDGSRSGYVGKAIKGALGSTLVKLNFPNIENNYAYYFLQSKYIEINTRAKGVGIPHVDPSILWNYDLLIPPKPTQQAIVFKIEELFSELDKGIENLHTAQQQLKTYRQAVLKWAFEGKLTNLPTGEAGENVKEGELPTGWKLEPLKNICKTIGGVTKGRDFKGKETIHLPYLRVANVQDGYLDLRQIKTIEVLPTDREKYKLLLGDILYTEGGDKDKLGRGTIWKNEIEDCIHQNHIFRARPLSKEINSKYIAYFSQTRLAKNYFFKHGKQTTNLASINLTILSNLPLPICSIEEQNDIVERIESRLSVADKMEESITQSLQKAEALRQSILKKAFEGKLLSNIEKK